MTALTIQFACDNSTFHMDPVGSHSPSESRLAIREASVIHNGDLAVVYRGKLTTNTDKKDVDVVVKLVVGESSRDLEDLEDEYNHYTRELKELQGHIVPKCYGLFHVPKDHVACLVLEYCGESIDCEFDELDMDLRLDILECLMTIHDAGLEHRDFEPRNVVLKDDYQPFIVDFGDATEHECERAMDIVEGALAPNEYHFHCWEIYRYAFENCIWRTGYFMVLGAAVPEKFATSYESVARVARVRGLNPFAEQEAIDRDIHLALELKKAIDENNNLRPRLGVLKAKGIL